MASIKLNEFETSPAIAEVKVSYKRSLRNAIKIVSSKDAFEILYSLFNKDTIEYREEFFLLLINRGNNMLGWIRLSVGGTSGTIADAKIIFAIAIQTNAHSIILSHNHPSGNLNPSKQDIELTERIKNGGKLFDITLSDHIIITPDGSYYSFANEGLL